MKQLYKTPESKDLILSLYNEKLESLDIEYENIDVVTSFGRTRVVKTGNKDGNIVFLFHGINAGAPLTLEAVKELGKDYLLFAIDTIGQATMSDENRINIEDNSYALWADEILKKLNIKDAYFIGISYGAYILQKLISYKPELVKAFVPEEDEFMFRLQKALLTNLNMDYRRPILLREKDVKNFNNPVYMIVSDNDVFFPGLESIDRAKRIFNNFREAHILKNSKHMPNKEDYFEIQQKIKLWLEE